MAIDHWLAFVAASAVILAIPGPTVLLIVSYALGHGRKPAVALATGTMLGDLTTMSCSMLGMGALLAASASLFTGLRWLGAAYLVFMGLKLWLSPVPRDVEAPHSVVAPFRMLGHAWLVTTLNPKSLVFFVAFVPQFLDASRPFWPQVGILEATFVTMSMLNALSYALLASWARGHLRSWRLRRAINCTGGSLLIATGVLAAGWRGANA